MMNFNWLVIPTLGLALVLFVVGHESIRRCRASHRKLLLSVLWLILAVPGLLFPMYYLHWFDNAKWFYELRSFPFAELTAAGAGLFAGALAELMRGSKTVSRPLLVPLFMALLCIGIVAPHVKPVLAPVAGSEFSDRWQGDVCLQSTPSSCGAASAATVFRAFGLHLTEYDIAKECYTYVGGTENWYIARAFRRRGCAVSFRITEEFPRDLRTPAIAGVCRGGFGHFIAILGGKNGEYLTGDPLSGPKNVSANDITSEFDFTGFFMEIQKKR